MDQPIVLDWRTRLTEDIGAIGLFLLLIAVFLTQVSDPPALLTGWRIASGFVIVGVLGVGIELIRDVDTSSVRLFVVIIGGGILLEGLARYRTTGPEGPDMLGLVVIVLALGALIVAGPTPVTHGLGHWIALVSFGTVVGLFVIHVHGPWGPTWPVWAVVTAGFTIFVVPRVVSRRSYLWTLALLSTIATVPALVSLVVGEFSIFGLPVHRSSQTVPILAIAIDNWFAHASFFNNVNVFGLVTFAGLASSLALVEKYTSAGHATWAILGVGCLLMNGLGLLLSNSGVSWVAGATTVGIYATWGLRGRSELLSVISTGGLITLALVVLAWSGLLPLDDGTRFARWESGIRGFLATPAVLGHGFISTAEFTAPFIDASSGEPHNSYLDMLIRIGPLGLLAYLILFLAPVGRGLARVEHVDVPMLAFVLGWAVHHLFESYTMMQWTIPAVLSALTLGYLIADVDVIERDDPVRVTGSKTRRQIRRPTGYGGSHRRGQARRPP